MPQLSHSTAACFSLTGKCEDSRFFAVLRRALVSKISISQAGLNRPLLARQQVTHSNDFQLAILEAVSVPLLRRLDVAVAEKIAHFEEIAHVNRFDLLADGEDRTSALCSV